MSTLLLNKAYTKEAVLPPLAKITVEELNQLVNKEQFTHTQLRWLYQFRGIVTNVSNGRIVGFNEE